MLVNIVYVCDLNGFDSSVASFCSSARVVLDVVDSEDACSTVFARK